MARRTEALRRICREPGLVTVPACHDALSARLVERAGFPVAFMSGYGASAARLALPDAGLISYAELLDQGRSICDAVSIPVIGDADTGFGSAANVRRTVEGYAKAGFAAVMIEDQTNPKRCGWAQGVAVCDRQEAVARLKAAVAARDAGADTLILGRTDAATSMGFEEGLWRAEAYQDLGCDIVYLEGAETPRELEIFCTRISRPKMFVAAEGVPGREPPSDRMLEALGFKFVCWALSLLNVSVRAMEEALAAFKAGGRPERIVPFEHLNEVAGMTAYLEAERRSAAE
jgi:2-methylisocitrate lyase-like PEP mutase family enzyme